MWWQIPPSGKIFHTAVGRKIPDFPVFRAISVFGTFAAKGIA
jgi:hypothetical protein